MRDEIPLCTLVGCADDWHRDDPQVAGHDADLTAQAIETCGHCPLRAPCAARAPFEHSGVWGGISASALRLERNEPDDTSDWVQEQRDHDAAAQRELEVLTHRPDMYANLNRSGRRHWSPSDPAETLASVELHGLKQTAEQAGVDRKTLRRWLASAA